MFPSASMEHRFLNVAFSPEARANIIFSPNPYHTVQNLSSPRLLSGKGKNKYTRVQFLLLFCSETKVTLTLREDID